MAKILPWILTCAITDSLCATQTKRDVYVHAARAVFVQNVYYSRYGKWLSSKRAREIVAWCEKGERIYGPSADWQLALGARETAFRNELPQRDRDGSGYMQMTADRAKLLDKRFKGWSDTRIEKFLVLNPEINILLAAKFLAQLKRGRTWREAASMYNVGECGNVSGEAATKHWNAVYGFYTKLLRYQGA